MYSKYVPILELYMHWKWIVHKKATRLFYRYFVNSVSHISFQTAGAAPIPSRYPYTFDCSHLKILCSTKGAADWWLCIGKVPARASTISGCFETPLYRLIAGVIDAFCYVHSFTVIAGENYATLKACKTWFTRVQRPSSHGPIYVLF